MEDQETLELYERAWHRRWFKSDEEWLAYCRKWWPRLPAIVDALNTYKEATSDLNN